MSKCKNVTFGAETCEWSYDVSLTSRDDPEWYLAESLITGQKGYIPFNFVAMNTVETEPYVTQEI